MAVQVDGDVSAPVSGLRIAPNDATYGTAPSAAGVVVMYPSGAPIPLRVVKVKVTQPALTAAATTQDITLWTSPVRCRIVRVIAQVNTAFTGGSVSAMTITAGNSAGGAQYLLSTSVFSGTPVIGGAVASVGNAVLTATWADYSATAITVQSRFTATTANLSTLTAGDMDFYIEYIAYPAM